MNKPSTQNDWEHDYVMDILMIMGVMTTATQYGKIDKILTKLRADARKEVKESNINLLTKELRWCQSDVAKGVFGMTIEQKQWFMNGLIQAITMLHRPKTKADWERIEATLREEEGK